jgi:hypothetical protein
MVANKAGSRAIILFEGYWFFRNKSRSRGKRDMQMQVQDRAAGGLVSVSGRITSIPRPNCSRYCCKISALLEETI